MNAVEFRADRDRPHLLHLVADQVIQATIDLDDPTYLDAEYMQRMTYLIDAITPTGQPLRTFHLGGGALAMARYIAATRPRSYQQAVEPSQEIIDQLRRYAPLPRGVKVKIRTGDARTQLEAAPENCYELIITDAFNGARVPAHLTTIEFLQQVKRVLSGGGHYTVNLCDGGKLHYLKSCLAGMAEEFDHLTLMAEPAVLRGRRYGNVVVCAAETALPEDDMRRRAAGAPFPCRVVSGSELAKLIGYAKPFTDATAQASPPPPKTWREH
ncbi:spermidine synthase [Natronoglycomyces albus]|uniref:Fused MFS/spermidine synthase n=1 Tax=Natronoglycomyces albus TaxID=2811108 RepID=A0A895XJY3_9ACTN|nr:fused MFS/spermidine synthase [Natronoglycomyces albus]QSB04122.1 fused MFS/spermidine synthase [Natronoglycomyces albus]